MPHAYTEDQPVEQSAIGLFAELGWQTVSAMEETFGATGTLLRETKGEVVLVSRLPEAYDRPLYAQKCSALFEHGFESYPEHDTGVYAAAV